METDRIGRDVTVLSDPAEIPGLGFLPVNTFVLHAEQPVVVDTGLSTPDEDYVADLAQVIDPVDVRSVWLTHPDCLGGPMSSAELATAPDVREVPEEERRAAQLLWAAVDSPWVHDVDLSRYAASVDAVRAMAPSAVLSTHLPPAVGMNDAMFEALTQAPHGPASVGPDQQALEALLASFQPA